MQAWVALAGSIAALAGVLVTGYFSYRSEKRKASTVELERVNQRAERYWAKVEDQQAQIVALKAEVSRLALRLSKYEEVST